MIYPCGWREPLPAAEALRACIRAQSKTVADHIAAVPEAKAFIDDWGWADRHR